MDSFHPLLERTRLPQPSLQKLAVISIFEKLRSFTGPESDPAIHAVAQCLNSNSPAVVDQSVRELCLLVKDSKLEVSRGLLELQSALEGSHSRFVSVFVKAIGFLVQLGFQNDIACFRFHSSEAHPFFKILTSRTEVQSELVPQLPDYLIDFPTLKPRTMNWSATTRFINWEILIAEVVRKGAEVPEIEWCEPGEAARLETLMGNKNGFLTTRLKNYSTDRNNPLKPKGLSFLSPYLHFGQISSQRCALEARKLRKVNPQTVDAFLEELIVHRELSDNFCYYQPHYDSLQGAWDWALNTLMDHALDKHEHIYTREQLEKGKTADPLWNAS